MRNIAYLNVLSSLAIICSGHSMDYTLPSTEPMNYYHYPTPRGAELHETLMHQHDYDTIGQYYQQQQQEENRNHRLHQSPSPSSATVTATIAKEFASPVLESAAFTMALTRQGYVVLDDATSMPIVPPVIMPNGVQVHPRSRMNSQNVKLPLPLGIAPIRFAPLPLQAGAPYSTVRGLTSYGTPYPQRRR